MRAAQFLKGKGLLLNVQRLIVEGLLFHTVCLAKRLPCLLLELLYNALQVCLCRIFILQKMVVAFKNQLMYASFRTNLVADKIRC